MFFLYDTKGHKEKFKTMDELRDYVEIRHAEEGGFDWISEIKDGKGCQYGCSWHLEIVRI
ncbi:MAG: hypothetical protein FJ266_01215 [Planctomycetes bacterium]|nr:hypothetical protein [Planctomycetota bacterium]